MLVRDHMARKVVTTDPQRSVADARALLKRHRIRQVPVVRGGRLIGIVTDRDLRSATATKPVAEAMTARPFTIAPDASVDEAARLLRTYKIGALPVVDGNELVGLIAAADILDAFVQLTGVAEPTYRIALGVKRSKTDIARVRAIVERLKGELKWLHYDGEQRPPQIHLRLKVRRVDDVVTAFEAAGFDVLSVVAPARKR